MTLVLLEQLEALEDTLADGDELDPKVLWMVVEQVQSAAVVPTLGGENADTEPSCSLSEEMEAYWSWSQTAFWSEYYSGSYSAFWGMSVSLTVQD